MKRLMIALIMVIVMVASLSIAGCTSSTSSNQAASNASQAASTTASSTTSAAASASAAPSGTPSATPSPSVVPTPTPTPTPVQQKTYVDFLAVALEYQAYNPISMTMGLGVNGGQGPSGLPVNMYINGVYSGQAVTGSGGTFEYTYQGMPVGNYTLTASFAGNGQYAPSSAAPYHIVVVAQLPQ
ncbi:MAG: Ig-like domain-containing protein [Halobacteriota archaeon]